MLEPGLGVGTGGLGACDWVRGAGAGTWGKRRFGMGAQDWAGVQKITGEGKVGEGGGVGDG